ncbi:MAG: transposase, partial [Blastocatellia bacterium]
MEVFPLGIDISKAKFDVALLRDEGKLRHKVFPNSTAGFQQLSAWLSKHSALPIHACMEATGTYSEALAVYLHEAGHLVSVVNPAIIKAFASTEMSRTKTDKADASLIARYCQKHQPPAWTPPPPEISELQALVRRLEALLEMLQQERNRLAAGIGSPSVKESVEQHIDYLNEQITHTQSLIRDHIDLNPTLKQQHDLLTTIPGIGDTTAAKLLAEIVEINHYQSARQVAAFAGLVPKHRESGSSVRGKPRLCKVGTARLRKAMYFPAIVATKHNPIIKAMSGRLRERGKCPMVIIGAAMRKLIHIAYGVLKSG